MRLFSYVLASDNGAAPNPFWGYCTLAICKPVIRRTAKPGDWVVGIGPAGKPTHGKLIYAMRVGEVLTLEQYFADPRFADKKPDDTADEWRKHRGDNVYYLARGRWRKLPGGTHTEKHLPKDTSGRHALIASHFYYFGTSAVEIPERLKLIAQGGQGHRSWFPKTYIDMLEQWLSSSHQRGVRGVPEHAPCCNAGEAGSCSTNRTDAGCGDKPSNHGPAAPRPRC